MTGEGIEAPGFAAQLALLQDFLIHRSRIVEHIQDVLNGRRKPDPHPPNGDRLSRQFEDCFYAPEIVSDAQLRLRGQQQAAHWNSGFRPSQVAGLHNDLIDPVEMLLRGVYCWQQTRWPGRNGRIRYAQTLFNLYLLRQLVLLSMRLWDDAADSASGRLAQIQAVLDALWQSSPNDQPVLVRNACWLIPLAQSPTTEELAAYFEVAERVGDRLEAPDRLHVQQAAVVILGGHLRSQIRHYCLQDGVAINDDSVVRRTRTSNALDFALLIQYLVPLLEAYAAARQGGDGDAARELAGTICQGISPDPELFLNRVELLGAYSMIEHLFVATDDDGQVAYTPMGRRHLRLLRDYAGLIGLLAAALHGDSPAFRPADGAYSPYGAIFGTPSNLLEDMALKTLQPDTVTDLGLAHVFADDGNGVDRLGWVNGWRQLPHVDEQVQKRYQYPPQYADEMFERIAQELRRAVADGGAAGRFRTGRLCIAGSADPEMAPTTIPALPRQYFRSSDRQMVAAGKAEFLDTARLLHERREGHFSVSQATANGWMAISKDFLTEVLGAGQDAGVAGLPAEAAAVLRLMCPGLETAGNAPANAADQAIKPASIVKA